MSLPTVGIIGAGQLARMMIGAAIPLDLPVRLLAARADDGAARVCPNVVVGSPDDPEAVARFAASCDVVTFDHELVPPAVLDRLDAEGVSLAPSSATMRIAQNKREQRERFAAAGLPQPRWQVVTGVDEAVFGLPAIVKAAAGGYDGRGVWRCDTAAELRAVLAELHGRGIEPIVDECVPIERELAMLVARLACGDVALYPLVETVQVDGICREIRAQAFDRALERQAREIAQAVAEVTGVVGILAVELFQAGGKLLINEIATRPHNSGHWTIEGSVTSQFEQHLRAVAGLPLGATRLHYPATVTVNVLGPIDGSDPVDHLADALRVDGAHVHLYGKRSRPGRKLGHVTAVGGRADACRAAAWTAVTALTGEEPPEALR